MWLLWISSAWATWTVAGIDPATGEVGVAGATCSPMVWMVAELVPGQGAVVSQYDTSLSYKHDLADAIAAGKTPEEALGVVIAPGEDSRLDLRQYGLVGFAGPAAGFTGAEVEDDHGWFGDDVVSVQGNTLRTEDLPRVAAETFHANADLALDERLLLALEAGRDLGGDARCPEDEPARSAFLYVAREDDDAGAPTVELRTSKFGNGDDPVVRLRREWERGSNCAVAPGWGWAWVLALAASRRRGRVIAPR